jgi:hypothetical protein
MNIPLICKNCGCNTFKTASKPKEVEDFIGAICVQCGKRVREDDIRAHACKVGLSLLRDPIRKARRK